MNDVAKIHAHLDDECRHADAANRRRSLLQVGLIGLTGLIAFAVLDYFLVFPRSARAICFLALASAVIWQLVNFVKARARAISRKQIAGEVEKQSGQETLVITTAADEHVRETSVADEVGSSLLQRLDERAIELARSTPLRSSRAVVPWRRALTAAVAALLIFGVVGGWVSYSRVLLPWAELPYTRVQLEGPADHVAALASFELTGTLRGRKTKVVELHNSFNDQVTKVAIRPDYTFEISLPGISDTSTFWITAGDGTSNECEVRVFQPAEFDEFVIEVKPPKYASHLATVHDGPNFEVLRGSTLDYRVRLTREVKAVNLLILPDGTGRIIAARPFTKTEDPLVYRLETDKFSRDLKYRLELTHADGKVSRNDEPFRILTLDDDPPHLTITGHNGKEVIKTGEEDVTVQLKATDDVGLSSAELVYRKIGNPGETQSLPLDSLLPMEIKASSLLKLAPLELQPLDVVAIHAEGRDGNTFDGPGIGKSQVVMIEVPEPPREEEGGGGGGGGGGQAQVVNPLEMQKFILLDTSKLLAKSGPAQFTDLQKDQAEANHYTQLLVDKVKAQTEVNPRARGLAAQLELALSTMHLSQRQLKKAQRDPSVLAQEFAVATLTKAAQMMGGPT